MTVRDSKKAGAFSHANLRQISSTGLVVAELIVIAVVALWTVIGCFQYAWKTGFTLEGLLPMLDKNWKGALILAGLLFFRTLQEILYRIEKLKTPLGEIPTGAPLQPSEAPTKKRMEQDQ